MTPLYIYHVDAFTAVPFRGNPAGVCILDEEPPAQWMQNMAMEMNLSETAFLFQKGDKLSIRFFTPAAEVDLCGHATLSASHILFETGKFDRVDKIVLSSKAGELTVTCNSSWIVMNFPAYPLEPEKVPDEFEEVVGALPAEYFRSAYDWRLALLRNETELRNLSPDFSRMKHTDFGDLIATSLSDDREFDFCVRCFAPALGVDEDPVTGSAHCALVPFWSSRLGKKELLSRQVSRREGILRTALRGERVEIAGQAITIMKNQLLI